MPVSQEEISPKCTNAWVLETRRSKSSPWFPRRLWALAASSSHRSLISKNCNHSPMAKRSKRCANFFFEIDPTKCPNTWFYRTSLLFANPTQGRCFPSGVVRAAELFQLATRLPQPQSSCLREGDRDPNTRARPRTDQWWHKRQGDGREGAPKTTKEQNRKIQGSKSDSTTTGVQLNGMPANGPHLDLRRVRSGGQNSGQTIPWRNVLAKHCQWGPCSLGICWSLPSCKSFPASCCSLKITAFWKSALKQGDPDKVRNAGMPCSNSWE